MMHSRNSFAREELHSTREEVFATTCKWCGGVCLTKHRYPRRYLRRFRVETDGGRTFQDRELFCSRDCREAYRS